MNQIGRRFTWIFVIVFNVISIFIIGILLLGLSSTSVDRSPMNAPFSEDVLHVTAQSPVHFQAGSPCQFSISSTGNTVNPTETIPNIGSGYDKYFEIRAGSLPAGDWTVIYGGIPEDCRVNIVIPFSGVTIKTDFWKHIGPIWIAFPGINIFLIPMALYAGRIVTKATPRNNGVPDERKTD